MLMHYFTKFLSYGLFSAPKEAKPKKKAAPKRKKKSSDLSDVSDGEFSPKPKKKAVPKKAPAKKKQLVSFSDSDDDIKPKKKATKVCKSVLGVGDHQRFTFQCSYLKM